MNNIWLVVKVNNGKIKWFKQYWLWLVVKIRMWSTHLWFDWHLKSKDTTSEMIFFFLIFKLLWKDARTNGRWKENFDERIVQLSRDCKILVMRLLALYINKLVFALVQCGKELILRHFEVQIELKENRKEIELNNVSKEIGFEYISIVN